MRKKGRVIGEGKPLICVPVTEETKEGIIEEIRLLVQKQADMIEWRVDWYEHAQDAAMVAGVLEEVRSYLAQTLFVLTFRSKRQGGQRQLTPKEVLEINRAAAGTGVPDFIDLEYFEYDRPKKAIQSVRECGASVICSHHDFEETPDGEILWMLLDKMKKGGADIVKLAVMPNTHRDVLALLEATEQFKRTYPDTPVITMSMGKEGVISRLCGEVFGSCVTFGSHKKASAPGQMQMEDLEIVLEKIHKSIS